VVVAALSLLAPWALAFDPYAWLVWGREIAHGTLDTSAGPSWKPLPVLFTLPLSAFGSAAPAVWAIVARTGALLALAGAAALAARLAAPGRTARLAAAVAAALVLALSPWWWFNAALGNSEGLLAAAVLWAAVAHLDGRRRLALAALLAGALIRPEVWPFLGLYGLWLLRDRAARAPVAAAFLAVPLLWFVPGALGGGGASSAAQGTPSEGSAALADVPFLAVLGDAAQLLTVPAAIAVVLALRDRRARALAACALGYVLIVAVMTQAGYAGNPRYLVPAAALGAALAAAGAARAPLAALLVVAVAVTTLGDLRDQTREIGARAATRQGLDALHAKPCGAVVTSVPQRTAVAWRLRIPIPRVATRVQAGPTTILRARPYGGGPLEPSATRGRLIRTAPRWELREQC
jgi:hypothetical protein